MALEKIRYNPKTGRFIDTKGRFVSEARIERLAKDEVNRTKARLRNVSNRYLNGQRTLKEWETGVASIIKDSHIRLGTLAVGGRKQLTASYLGKIGARLKVEYEYLDKFANAIANGTISEKQIVFRSTLYAQSAAQTFHAVRHSARINEGFTFASRRLDAIARHCPDCPNYDTRGKKIPIELVVPRGVNCRCRGNCRCQVKYYRF